MKNKSAIAILGGMGPEASSYMYKTLIDLSIKYFDAQNNDDFPEIILQSIPVPDFISDNKNKNIARKMLIDRVKNINKLNVSSISIACNTAHLLLDELQKISNAPFVSMIDEVALAVQKDKFKKVGILGSPVTIKSRLYQNKLEQLNVKVITPSENDVIVLEQIIRNIIKGNVTPSDYKKIMKITKGIMNSGAEAIILGCTELPLIFSKKYKKIKIYDSVEVLSIALLQNYYK